jgi:hypothetical protein
VRTRMTMRFEDTSFPWIQGCTEWIEEHRRDGCWKIFYVNFMFDALSGSPQAVMAQMRKGIVKFYGRFCRRFVHHPKAESEQARMPRFFLFPDKPVWKKHSKACISELKMNDGGSHYNGFMLTPMISRFRDRCPIAHIDENQDIYCQHGIRRIHVKAVYHIPGISDYSAKTVKWHRADENDILILPRSVNELRDSRRVLNPDETAIRDIQAKYNVSTEMARRMACSP